MPESSETPGPVHMPTDAEWHDLFAAFSDFCQAAPWRWMTASDLLAVEHSPTGETGYCVVMGSGGQEFGLALYIGDIGLKGYLSVMSEEVDPGSIDAFLQTNAVSATVVDRTYLEPADRALLRRLGIKIRRGSGYPLFRSVRPGFLPWYLNADEAVFMTAALRNVLDVAMRVMADEVDLHEGGPDAVLTRVLRDDLWQDERRALELPPPAPAQEYPDTARLQRLASAQISGGYTWELGVFHLLFPIQEKKGDRPYLPTAVLVVDGHSHLILQTAVLGNAPSTTEIQDVLVAALEEADVLPAFLLVDSEHNARLYESVAEFLGIHLSVGVTAEYQEMKDSLMDYFEQPGDG